MSKLIQLLDNHDKLVKVSLALISFALYLVLFSWQFSLLLMVSIGWHEYGHVWAMNRIGLSNKGFMFLPFIGGVAVSTDRYITYADSAYVAIMGPIWGVGSALACMGMYYATHANFWIGATVWMALVNLFNLIPINPLDGGNIVHSLSYSVNRKFGLAMMTTIVITATVLILKSKVYLLLFILPFTMLQLIPDYKFAWSEFKYRRACKLAGQEPESLDKYFPATMSKAEFVKSVMMYVWTAVALITIMHFIVKAPGFDVALKNMIK